LRKPLHIGDSWGAKKVSGQTVGQARSTKDQSTAVLAMAQKSPYFHAWGTQFMTTVGESAMFS